MIITFVFVEVKLPDFAPFCVLYDKGKIKMDSVQGCQVLCEALVKQGVKYMFGVVGIPVIEIALAAQSLGIKYFGMRNEQAVRTFTVNSIKKKFQKI